MRCIRVLDILPALNVDSGVASYEMSYLRGLDHQQFIVDIAIYAEHDTPYYDEVKSYGGEVFILPPLSDFSHHIQKCKEILNKTNYDIVHNNTLSKSIILFCLAKKNHVKTRIFHSHSAQLGDSKKKRFLNRIAANTLIRLSTQLVACSEASAKCYFGNRSYYYLPNVISSKKFAFEKDIRDRIRSKYSVEKKIVISTVGRISSEKNPYFILDIVRELIKRSPKAVFWWIGTGSLAENVKEYAKQIGVQDNVVFWGGRTDVQDLYQAMDVFLLPSFFEGMLLSCIEAQAMGLPCIISNSITKEVAFTDLVHYVDLDAGPAKWADIIIENTINLVDRRNYNVQLRKSAFSDESAGNTLMNYYRSLIT